MEYGRPARALLATDDGTLRERTCAVSVADKSTIPPPLSFTDHVLADHALRLSLIPQLDSLRHWRVLDLGCGRGILAGYLALLGAKVIGLDVGRSHDWNPSCERSPLYVVGRGERLPFGDNSFDAVLSCSTLQYQDHRQTFAEMIRVTRDQGMLFLHENMPYNPFIAAYRCVLRLQATYHSPVAAYLATIHSYLSPRRLLRGLRFRELHLVSHACYYLFAPLVFCWPRVRVNSAGLRLLLALDRALLAVIPFLNNLAWFCTYHIKVVKDAPLVVPQNPSIGQLVKSYAETKSLKYLFLALTAIVRQRRFAEAVYGAFCFAVYRPAVIVTNKQTSTVINPCLELVNSISAEIDAVDLMLARTSGLPKDLISRRELVVRTPRGHIIGEYTVSGRSARLFHVVDGMTFQFDHYNHIHGVRHLHSIVDVGDGKLLVSTGDSARFLDEWHIGERELVFHRRLMRWFGGFTAYVKLGDIVYFGTDFTERPNYLFRLHDRRKFFFPAPSFRQYAFSMALYEDRYIVCLCCSIYGASSVAIFDTQIEQFIHCGSADIPRRSRLFARL